MKKKILWLCFIALVLGGGFLAYEKLRGEDEAAKIETAAVARGTIEDIVTAQGKLEPRDYVDVGAQVSGQLKKLYVDIGDRVQAGDLLAELDPRTYEAKVKAGEADIGSLKAQLEQQKAQADYDRLQFERAQKLVKTKALSEQEAEEKEKTLKVSQAAVASLEAQIAQAEANLETNRISLGYTKIYAPMSGIVSDKSAEEGETLNANQTTPTIVRIANLEVMTVRAQVAEADVMRLKPGMESTFSTLGSGDRRWKGTIRQILPTPEEINDVILYNALIDVENKDGQLMNGMSTQNTFVAGRAEGALTIPTRALGRREAGHDDPEKGAAYSVRVMKKNGGIEEREIFVGLVTRSKAEVRGGLSEGEEVVVSGATETAKKVSGGPRLPGMARL